MNTQVIVLGAEKKEKKPIVFERMLNNVSELAQGEVLIPAENVPSDFNFIELICREYQSGSDLMFAYDDPNKRENGMLYIGKFNDGVIYAK